jgi:hypothetical protein
MKRLAKLALLFAFLFSLYIQHDSPGKDKESNWLPAPSGPFVMCMRLYWPKQVALDGTWKQPPLQRAE